MIALTKNLLDRSPEETARHLCLRQIEEAAEALDRLEAGTDAEALHDFRVALRRLRSQIRAYRPYLEGSKPRKLRARIKELAARTNAARDAEVSIEWLEKEGASLGDEGAAGARHLTEVLRSHQARTPSAAELRQEFEPLRAAARKALSRLSLRVGEPSESFLAASGRLLGELARGLEAGLRAVHTVEDGEPLHRARILAKRLRYLLEPLRLEVAGVTSLVETLKSLQDCLGELQDTRVLIETIGSTLEQAALVEARRVAGAALGAGDGAERLEPRPQAGLIALLGAQRQRRDRRFEELQSEWLGASGRVFFAEVEALAERLADTDTGEAPKRRFLLRARPASLGRAPGVLLRQGWLPGKAVREEVRSESSGRRVRRSRVVTLPGRPSVEEPLSRARFEAFWKLTERRRLERRRFRIPFEGRIWYVDEIPARGIVLAEVQANGDASLPPSLQEVLVREVTGSKKYAPEALAAPAAHASSLGS